MLKTFGWVVGVFLVLAGLVLCTVNIFAGLFFIFLGAVFIQYARGYEQLNINDAATHNNQSKIIKDLQPSTSKQDSVKKSNPVTASRILDRVKFKYSDYEGNITERIVDVTSGKKGEQFTGHCHLKNDARTFYYKRIIDFEVIRVNTGEIMTPMAWRYEMQGTKVAEKAMLEEQARQEK